MFALAAGLGVGRFVYTPILPAMVDGLRLSKSDAGLIASANFVGYLLGALLASSACVPGQRRTWLLGALVLCGASTGAMGLVSSMPAFLILRFAAGAASALILVYASSLVLDRLAQASRNGLSGLHFAGVGVGIALSAVLISGLVAAGADWRVLWLASGGMSLAAVAAVALLLPRGRPQQSAATRPPRVNGSATGQGFPALTLAYGLFGFGYVVTATFLVAIVRDSLELRSIEPLVWIIVGIAASPSVALWTPLGARFGIAHAFALACLTEAVGVAASVLWPTMLGTFLAAALLGGTFMGITSLGLAGARRLAAGRDPQRALGLLTASFGAGQIAGPTLAGYLHDQMGGFMVPSLLATGALLAAAAIVTTVWLPPATTLEPASHSRSSQ